MSNLGQPTAEERRAADYACAEYFRRTGRVISRNQGRVADIIKQRWRDGNQRIVSYWSQVESLIRDVIQRQEHCRLGHIAAFIDGKFLRIQLPSGRSISYLNPYIKSTGEITYDDPKYGTVGTYGGKLVENIVQAVARDIMAEAMYRLEQRGYPCAFTVHDEVVSTADTTFLSISEFEEFEKIILQTPKWAAGLPIAIETWSGKRYGK